MKQDRIISLFSRIKRLLEKEQYINDFIIEDKETYLNILTKPVKSDAFKLHIEMSNDPDSYQDKLGVYLSFEIEFFTKLGFLFVPNNDNTFNVFPTGSNLIRVNNKIDNHELLQVIENILFIYNNACKQKINFIKNVIEKVYKSDKDILEENFVDTCTHNKIQKYVYYIDKKNNLIFIDDFNSLNTTSVTNAIESIVFDISQSLIENNKIKKENLKDIKWINIYCNFYERGIILQENIFIEKYKIITKFFGLFSEEQFDKLEFENYNNTWKHIDKKDLQNIWCKILSIDCSDTYLI